VVLEEESFAYQAKSMVFLKKNQGRNLASAKIRIDNKKKGEHFIHDGYMAARL
jgi:hypothetical protein